MRKTVERLEANWVRQLLPLTTLVFLIVLVGAIQPGFLEPSTLLQLAADTAVLFILGTVVTFVIVIGGIDLSLQSMASLASVIVALTVTRFGYGSFVLAVGVGALAGLLSGLAHVRLKIPSFIATLAMGGVLYSTALVISKERSITLGDAERGYQTWITGTVLGVPNVIVSD
jgi:ribose transport system permease protein